ncbi:MAG: LysE family transporter [Anaerolineae bacterium]
MLQLLIMGMTMGLAFAAPPGIVTAETFRRGVRGGFGHALSVQLGSLIGDASYALMAFVGLATLVQGRVAQEVVGTLGALFLLYLAWQSFRTGSLEMVIAGETGGYREAFVSGMLLSLTNPWAIAFWVSFGGSLVAIGLRTADDLPLLFASFMLGSLLWSFVLAGLIERGRRLLSPRLFRIVSILCGLLLAGFGVSVAARVLSTLFV